jgi:hypothetical protein
VTSPREGRERLFPFGDIPSAPFSRLTGLLVRDMTVSFTLGTGLAFLVSR